MRRVDGDEGIVDGGIGGAEAIDCVEKIADSLILGEGTGDGAVVDQQGRDQVARFGVGWRIKMSIRSVATWVMRTLL